MSRTIAPGPASSTDPYEVWVAQNPLRRWRASNGWSIMRTASSIGCSMTIIQLWEKGVHVPSDQNMAQIERLLGPAAMPEWTRWWNSKPE